MKRFKRDQICPSTCKSIAINIDRINAWTVFFRLQQLGIDCHYGQNKPLVVEIISPSEVLQVWSVIQQITASRHDNLSRLERCWKAELSISDLTPAHEV
ncbi:MAG: Asr1405/Asl0597 family protein [Cyanobacteria bacterium P01_H01_bin.15]